MRRSLLALAALAVTIAASANDASACSCAVADPRRMLTQADGAFVGVLLERHARPSGTGSIPSVTLVFRVEHAVKGVLTERLEVVSAADGASCGIEAGEGERLGLFLRRVGGQWRSSLCEQIEPDALLAAARPLPAPDGRGPIAVLAGGSFGRARVVALDREGRTLGYGLGSGETVMLDVCPGSRRAVELVRRGRRTALAVRDLRTLRRVSERPLRLGGLLYPSAVDCRTRTGENVLVFAASEAGRLGVLFRARSGRVSELYRGRGFAAAFGRRRAYITIGQKANALVAVDLASGGVRRLGRVPASMGALALSPEGRWLAGVAYSAPFRGAPASRVAVVDLARRPVRSRTAQVGRSNVSGRVAWLARNSLVFLAGGGDQGVLRIYDASLRLRSRLAGWDGWPACARRGTAYGVRSETPTRVIGAKLPTGPTRLRGALPSPIVYALEPVPGTVTLRSAATRQGSGSAPSAPIVDPPPQRQGTSLPWIASAAIGAIAVGAVLAALWRLRRIRRAPAQPDSRLG